MLKIGWNGKIKGGKLCYTKFYPPPNVTIAKKKFVYIKFWYFKNDLWMFSLRGWAPFLLGDYGLIQEKICESVLIKGVELKSRSYWSLFWNCIFNIHCMSRSYYILVCGNFIPFNEISWNKVNHEKFEL